MRGRDIESGEFLSPSRSQQRRDALAIFALAERLVSLGDRELAAVPMPDDLRDLVRDSRRITQQIARKRQLQFLAKIMRREDDEVINAIRRVLERDRDESRRDTARLHRTEAWRDRLLAEGDTAVSELLTLFPDADRQRVRQLIRNAKLEREKQRPPHAYRELFQLLRELFAEHISAEDEAFDDDIDAEEDNGFDDDEAEDFDDFDEEYDEDDEFDDEPPRPRR